MKDRYRQIEGEYYDVLSRIYRKSAGIPSETKFSRKELPYLVEAATLDFLLPRKNCMISGISGSGKTTVTVQLEKMGYKRLRNITTRPRRPSETDVDYVFTSSSTFREWRKKGLVFHSHRRNKSWHGILLNDLRGFLRTNDKYYADKSASSVLKIEKAFGILPKTTFIYLLPPTFKELHLRISEREKSERNEHANALSPEDVLDRFKEEIGDLRKTTKIPYAYVVNDSRSRVSRLIGSRLKKRS